MKSCQPQERGFEHPLLRSGQPVVPAISLDRERYTSGLLAAAVTSADLIKSSEVTASLQGRWWALLLLLNPRFQPTILMSLSTSQVLRRPPEVT